MDAYERPLAIETVSTSALDKKNFRLDAGFYRGEFAEASVRLARSGLVTRKLGDMAGAFVPARMKLVTTSSPSAGAAYLRAHDSFDIRPRSNRYVSERRSKDYRELLLKEGMILTPSSGRNLGPVTYVGKYLAGFAMTDIMRIVPKSRSLGFYLLAYLLTPTAQTLIRRGRSGTTVDHLSPDDVLGIDVPWIKDSSIREALIERMQRAERLIDAGRRGLDSAAEILHREAGLLSPVDGVYLSRDCGDAFGLSSRDVFRRLDAASYHPAPRACADAIKAAGGTKLGQVARLKTLDRYVRYYVEPPNGRPVLSGRQMLQLRPVNLRRISDRSFKDPGKFVLKAGSTIFTCDGRSEEALGEPAYVMPYWDGWMASEHVMRVEPTDAIGSGYLYLCLASPWVQQQLKAQATGSVIDALEPEEIADVFLPMLPTPKRRTLDKQAVRCWTSISEGIRLAEQVAHRFEQFFRTNSRSASAK